MLDSNGDYNLAIGAMAFAAAPVITIGISALVNVLEKSRRPQPKSSAAWKITKVDITKCDLMAWLADDRPIATLEFDVLGHRSIARRIALRLQPSKAQAQAVLGELGTGKTSIRSLVTTYLKDCLPASDVRIVPVDLWPYDTPHAAVEGILRALIKAFSAEVNTFEVDGIPPQYVEVIAKLTGVSKWIPNISERNAKLPSSLLAKLDALAKSIGRRYVLWIEDLERFASGHSDADEAQRLSPIRALLYGLDQLDAISVITATTDLERRFDVDKIARYVERIPGIEIRKCRRIISHFRNTWLSGDDIIYPGGRRGNRFGWDDPGSAEDAGVSEIVKQLVGDRIGNVAMAVAALAQTPRALKQGLRRAQETWMALRGEIDLDEVIALSILRESSPNAFSLLERSVPEFRRLRRERSEKDPFSEFGDSLKALKLNEPSCRAISLIVTGIFKEGKRYPQSVSSHRHTDYWYHFQTVPDLDGTVKDQEILRIIDSDSDAPLLACLCDSERTSAIESFSSRIESRRLGRLLVAVVEQRAAEVANSWEHEDPPGISALYRMARERDHATSQMLAEDVKRAIEIAARRNLALLERLLLIFATTTSDDRSVLFDDDMQLSLRKYAHGLFLETHLGDAERLVADLSGAPRRTLIRLCYASRSIPPNGAGKPFDDWDKFSKTLLDALQLSAETIAPQLSMFVSRLARKVNRPDLWIFDRARCEELFGDADQFVKRFRECTENCKSDTIVQAVRDEQADVPDEGDDPDIPALSVDGDVGDGSDDSDRPGVGVPPRA